MTGRSSGGVKKQHAAQLFKTEMCKFYLQGSCENGRQCSYAHNPSEIRHKPDLTNTSMCKNFARDGQCSDPQCRFAHSEAQLRATSGFFKMKMCGFVESGRCKNGDSCRFAHSVDELRPPSQAAGKKQQPRPQPAGSPGGTDGGYDTPEPLGPERCRLDAPPAHGQAPGHCQPGGAPAAVDDFAGAPQQGHHGQPHAVQPFQQMVPYMMMPMEAFVPMDGPYGQEDQGFAYRGTGVPMARGGWQDSSSPYGV